MAACSIANTSMYSVPSLDLTPLVHTTLHEQAYQRLKKAFLSGRFLPGQVITLRGLARQFGTSIIPVRDAINRLATEQIFEFLPSRVIRIPVLSREQSREIWRLRVLLEGEAAALAARLIDEDEVGVVARLCDEVRELAEQGDLHAMLDRNDSFHFAVFRAARTHVLIRLIERLRMQAAPQVTRPFTKLLRERPPFFEATFDYHAKLVEALRRHDSRAAMRIRRQDIRSMRAWVFANSGELGWGTPAVIGTARRGPRAGRAAPH